jgi:5,10-methenyltetrahydromethanopterin hydrogenase
VAQALLTGAWATFLGDEIMSLIKLKAHRVHGPLILRRGGEDYSFIAQENTKVPLNVAVHFIGNNEMEIIFTKKDKDAILGLTKMQLEILKKEFKVDGGYQEVVDKLYPPKIKIPKLDSKPKKKTED